MAYNEPLVQINLKVDQNLLYHAGIYVINPRIRKTISKAHKTQIYNLLYKLILLNNKLF